MLRQADRRDFAVGKLVAPLQDIGKRDLLTARAGFSRTAPYSFTRGRKLLQQIAAKGVWMRDRGGIDAGGEQLWRKARCVRGGETFRRHRRPAAPDSEMPHAFCASGGFPGLDEERDRIFATGRLPNRRGRRGGLSLLPGLGCVRNSSCLTPIGFRHSQARRFPPPGRRGHLLPMR